MAVVMSVDGEGRSVNSATDRGRPARPPSNRPGGDGQTNQAAAVSHEAPKADGID